MEIYQKECNKQITGKITDSSGDPLYLLGEVNATVRGCVMSGILSKTKPPKETSPSLTPSGEGINISGIFEKDRASRKWQVKNGTYSNNGNDCDGTFSITQQ
jgi:uncharacterized protein (DUF2147 family)